MRECWINVYDRNDLGCLHLTKEQSDYFMNAALRYFGWKVVYRIHVRMK